MLPPFCQGRQPRNDSGKRVNAKQARPDAKHGSHIKMRKRSVASSAIEIAELVFTIGYHRLFLDELSRKAGREQVHRLPNLRSPKKCQKTALRIALLIAAVSSPRVIYAQSQHDVAPETVLEPVRQNGVRVGNGFLLVSDFRLGGEYDSNVYNTPTGKRDDLSVVIAPKATLRSNWSRHEVSLDLESEVRRYRDLKAENSEQYSVAANSLLELGYNIDVRARAGFARRIERRGTSGDDFLTDAPVEYDETFARLEVSRSGNRLGLKADAAITKRDFNAASINDAPIDLSSRDLTIMRGSARADLRISDRTRTFIEGRINTIDYSLDSPIDKDSDGLSALAGIHHEITGNSSIEIAAGYMEQHFDNPNFASYKGVNYSLDLDWLPRPQLRLTASAARTMRRSPFQNVPVVIESDFRIQAEKSFHDSVFLRAQASHTRENYREINRTDKRWAVGAEAEYRLTRNLGAFAGTSYRKQTSNGGRQYSGFRISFGVRMVL